MSYCRDCGFKVEENDKFCTSCGSFQIQKEHENKSISQPAFRVNTPNGNLNPQVNINPINKGNGAVASLILGVFSALAWLIPFFGVLTAIIGFTFGVKNVKSKRQGMAIAGLVLCSVFLVVSSAFSIFSAIKIVDYFHGKAVSESNVIENTNSYNSTSEPIKDVSPNVSEETKDMPVEKTIEEIAKNKDNIVVVFCGDALGSGILLNKNGDILTNFHVVSQLADCFIAFDDGKGEVGPKKQVEIVKYDEAKDLALLKLSGNILLSKEIEIGDSSKIADGQKVVAIGNPRGLVNTVSDGIISGVRQDKDITYIQTTAPITHGSSGGALFNMKGELIGITTAIYEGSGNLNFAISSNDIKRFLTDSSASIPSSENKIQSEQNYITYENYTNGRYGFSIDYPADFVKDTPPANGDGLIFSSESGDAELIVSGYNNIDNSSIEAMYDNLINEVGQSVIYKYIYDNWFIVSWNKDNKEYFFKLFVGEGSANSCILSYPAEQKDNYSGIIERLNESFSPGDLAISH